MEAEPVDAEPVEAEAPGGEAGRRLRRAQAAAMVILCALALLFAAWAPRIPQVKRDLGLSDGQLGLALLGAPVGGVATLGVAGLLVGRFGSRPVIRLALVGYCTSAVLLAAARGTVSLFAVLVLLGALSCLLDIAVNAQAVTVERRIGRPIMSTVHAAWTGGALLGAGVGSGAAAVDLPLGLQLAALGAVGLLAGFPVTSWMVGGDAARRTGSETVPETSREIGPDAGGGTDCAAGPGEVSDGRGTGRRTAIRGVELRRLTPFAALCAISFATFLCEGVAADWSAVYLTDVTGATAGVAGVGLVAYMTCMLVVRLAGDRAVARFGPVRTVRALALCATAVFGLALAAADTGAGTAFGIVGFAALGAGLACAVPTAFSAAGRLGAAVGVSGGASIALVSSVGYVGWLGGPVIIGGFAELVGLRATMWTVVALTGVIALLARTLHDRSLRL